MNPDLRKLRLMCDQCTESGSKLNVLLAQGRARGLRADTFQHVELRHLTWRKTVVNDRFRLCLDMEIVKDKTVLQEVWKQNNPGWVDISMCPNIALLIYLANHRQVFKCGSAAKCIIKNDFTLKDGCENEPLFTPKGKFTTWKNKDMSNAMKNLSRRIGKTYSTRSLRLSLLMKRN